MVNFAFCFMLSWENTKIKALVHSENWFLLKRLPSQCCVTSTMLLNAVLIHISHSFFVICPIFIRIKLPQLNLMYPIFIFQFKRNIYQKIKFRLT